MDVRASQCKCVGQWMGEYHSASGWNSECAGDLAKFQQADQIVNESITVPLRKGGCQWVLAKYQQGEEGASRRQSM
eukprot:1161709-Pelagomonas_calceolata.AAC.1